MNSRNSRSGPQRSSGSALIHRGPQAFSAPHVAPQTQAPPVHAPKGAALLIDFDNVTMSIRSDLGKELRTLLSSDIIKGKVAVQRAYADWRRYPQYIVPLAESSIDMIMAPAYGTSKKNATDIRLAVDAMELVFTRPEIGTYILLSGDSDFASLVTKLKEYGKYVIGVGIRESASDLLVMNCDEYYSYNALAGLIKTNDEEPAKKWDPWELVGEAVGRMKRNGDVMRSDRLKQVMQEIDSTFDEKELGMSKFSRFVQDAVNRGVISATKLENGQLEVGPSATAAPAPAAPEAAAAPNAEASSAATPEDRKSSSRSRRGRRGRGGRDREERPRADTPQAALESEIAGVLPPTRPKVDIVDAGSGIGLSGERLTRDEAFDLMRRSIADLLKGDEAVRASVLRSKARDLLGRDSESLSDRNFPRILKDAHDNDVIDLRRRGDDFEVARVPERTPVADTQSAPGAPSAANSPSTSATPPLAPRGMGPRGVVAPRGRSGRPGAPPPELLSIGVVKPASTSKPETVQVSQASPTPIAAAPQKPAAKKTAAKKTAAKKVAAKASAPKAKAVAPVEPPRPAAKKPRAKRAGAADKT